MIKYIIKRIGTAVVTLGLITVVVFFIIQLPPGDFVDSIITEMITAGDPVTEEMIVILREAYGVDRPFIIQYFDWLSGLLTGNWGVSFFHQQNVLTVINETLVATLILSLVTLIFTYFLSIPAAIFSAKNQYSIGDYIVTALGFVGMAIPNFLFAILLMYFSFRWLGHPLMGLPNEPVSDWASFVEWVQALIIPTIVIGTSGTAALIRFVRAQLLDEMGKPYVLAARAKGVSENTITYKYQMRSVLNPIVSDLGNLISSIFTGSTIAAIVLMLPTLGPVLLTALQTQDIYLSGGILLISAILVVMGNLISDLLLMVLDPRINLLKGGGKAK